MILPDGRRVQFRRDPVPPGVPFTILMPLQPLQLEPPHPVPPPDPGDWVLAVARSNSGKIILAHGLYQTVVEEHCGSFSYQALQSSAPLSPALLGGGVFTIDGALLAFIADCDGKAIAITQTSVSEALRSPISENDRLEREYGFRVVSGDEQLHPGATVTAVWNASLAGTAGLRPGDLITGIDDARVESATDLSSLAGAPQADHILQLRRGKRIVRVSLPAAGQRPSATRPSPLGMTLGTDRYGRVIVVAVTPDSEAGVAGVRVGDAVLTVQGAGVEDRSALLSVLEKLNHRPVQLGLERGGNRIEVLVSP
jgi:S1-C subfamily serine protease